MLDVNPARGLHGAGVDIVSYRRLQKLTKQYVLVFIHFAAWLSEGD